MGFSGLLKVGEELLKNKTCKSIDIYFSFLLKIENRELIMNAMQNPKGFPEVLYEVSAPYFFCSFQWGFLMQVWVNTCDWKEVASDKCTWSAYQWVQWYKVDVGPLRPNSHASQEDVMLCGLLSPFFFSRQKQQAWWFCLLMCVAVR